MKTLKLTSLLVFCFSTSLLFAQGNFDVLIEAFECSEDQEITVKNLESINTPYLDYCPIAHKEGIVFSSNRPRKKGFISRIFNNENSNLFYTAQESDQFYFKPIELPGKINTLRHEGGSAFSLKDNLMVYTCNCKKRNNQGIYDLKLCTAKFIEGKWIQGEDLPFDTKFRTCHPTLSADGTILIFSAKRPGGYGGMDLYYSKYTFGAWQKPQNLGPEVNTEEDEVFPTLTSDGTLVFSTSGLPGAANLDLYYSKKNDQDEWATPINLGQHFNSIGDDFGFISFNGGMEGLFTSDRKGGKGKDDIYAWKINPIETPQSSPQLLTSNLLILDEATGVTLDQSNITLIEIDNDLLQTSQLTEELVISNEINNAILEILGKRVEPIAITESGHKYPIIDGRQYFLKVTQKDYSNIQKIVRSEHLLTKPEYAMVMHSLSAPTYKDITTVVPVVEEELIITPNIETSQPIIASMIIHQENNLAENVEIPPVEVPDHNTSTTIPTKEVFTSRGIPTDKIKDEPINLDEDNLTSKSITVKNIYYQFNKFELSDASKLVIDELIEEMEQNENLMLGIQSHTDARGKSSYNKWLSQKRADAVKEYMISRGVASKRLKAKGMGEEYLLIECNETTPCDDINHKKNRRTEFIINQNKYIISD